MKKYIIAFLIFFSFIQVSYADNISSYDKEKYKIAYNEGARYYISCFTESGNLMTNEPIKEIIEFKDGIVKYKQMNDAYGFSPAERCKIKGLSEKNRLNDK